MIWYVEAPFLGREFTDSDHDCTDTC